MFFSIRKENSENQRITSDEKGTAFIEFVVAAPFLILLMMGVIDCARLFNAYQAMNQLANNAVSLAANTSRLEVGTFASDMHGSGCGGLAAAPLGGKQASLQNRVVKLASGTLDQKDFKLNSDSVCICSEYSSAQVASAAGKPEASETVNSMVTARFDGLLPFLKNLKITANSRAPYLSSTTSDNWSGA